MMRIGIDIDGTMNQVFNDGYEDCKMLCEIYHHKYTFDPTKIKIKDQFQLTDFLYNLYMKIYFPETVKYSSLLPYCRESIHAFIKSGCEILCITSRDEYFNSITCSYSGKQMKRDTLKWFKENDLPFDKNNTYFSITNKGEFCKNNDIHLMIDDDPKHIQSCIDNEINCGFPIYEYNKHVAGISKYAKPIKYTENGIVFI